MKGLFIKISNMTKTSKFAMKSLLWLAPLWGAGVSSPLFSADRQDLPETAIEVIHSDEYPLHGLDSLNRQGLSFRLYNLDEGKRLLAGLSQNLPSNQDAAKVALEKRFQMMGEQSVQNRFQEAFKGNIKSVQYGLTRYPAVVFDGGKAVIYGVTDLVRALDLYRQWRQSAKEIQ